MAAEHKPRVALAKRGKSELVEESAAAGEEAPVVEMADVMDGNGVPFEVDGTNFYVRPPTTEEYDDALSIQDLVLHRMLAMPEIADLADTPCSEAERARYERWIKQAEKRFSEAAHGSTQRQAAADEVARLKRQIEARSLADEVASDRAVLARDRWLCMRLLCRADTDEAGRVTCGAQVFDVRSPHIKVDWERPGWLRVKDAARPAIWILLAQVQQAPLPLDLPRVPRSA